MGFIIMDLMHIMVPKIDKDVGMLVYSTDFDGVSGYIRKSPDDFTVLETLSSNAISKIENSGTGYATYLLKKRNIDTNHAIKRIHSKTGLRLKALGLKDARAVTEQYVCATTKSADVERFTAGQVSIKKIGYVKKPLSGKDMIGNRFSIRISDMSGDMSGFASFDRILNFFGYQRFGSRRPVSHLIGRAIVRRDFDDAVRLLLSFTSKHDTPEHNKLRDQLSDMSNLANIPNKIPPGMDLEKTVISEMIKHGDAKAALRAIPVSMRRFFVQAYQSFLFNLTLSGFSSADLRPQETDVCFDPDGQLGRYDGSPGQKTAMPLVGYSYYKKTRFDSQISDILESEQVRPRDFFIKEMQEASAEGGFRNALCDCKKFRIKDDLIEFTLSRGSFATIIIREIIKPSDPMACGF